MNCLNKLNHNECICKNTEELIQKFSKYSCGLKFLDSPELQLLARDERNEVFRIGNNYILKRYKYNQKMSATVAYFNEKKALSTLNQEGLCVPSLLASCDNNLFNVMLFIQGDKLEKLFKDFGESEQQRLLEAFATEYCQVNSVFSRQRWIPQKEKKSFNTFYKNYLQWILEEWVISAPYADWGADEQKILSDFLVSAAHVLDKQCWLYSTLDPVLKNTILGPKGLFLIDFEKLMWQPKASHITAMLLSLSSGGITEATVARGGKIAKQFFDYDLVDTENAYAMEIMSIFTRIGAIIIDGETWGNAFSFRFANTKQSDMLAKLVHKYL